jgi:hypothetical protein
MEQPVRVLQSAQARVGRRKDAAEVLHTAKFSAIRVSAEIFRTQAWLRLDRRTRPSRKKHPVKPDIQSAAADSPSVRRMLQSHIVETLHEPHSAGTCSTFTIEAPP